MTSKPGPRIGIVVPCCNEEKILPLTAARLLEALGQLIGEALAGQGSLIYFVDDGSSDGTWDEISRLAEQHEQIAGIKLTRNFGHQYALYAGLMEAEGDALISLDADLQDDIGVIGDMLREFLTGKDIVYGVRDDRASDTRFKRWSAAAHYWFAEKLGISTVRNHADYRLMSRAAIRLLSRYHEANLYLRGIVPLLGLPSAEVAYRRTERLAGESKYSIKKMISLSLRGITSFSIMPLRFITAMGILVFMISLILGLWALHAALFREGAVPGWASTVIPIYLLGGLQLFAIGVAGEYIGKTYMEVKRRPLYLVESRCGDNKSPAQGSAANEQQRG